MESLLSSIHPSDPIWIAIAFACGLALRLVGLPPLIGFLFAGFLLNALGAEGGEFLNATADLGITLLLFSIGLKLRLRELARPEVWGVATLHMVLIILLVAGLVLALSFLKIPLFAGLDLTTSLLVGFVLSFSSTVFAVKILDELGATSSNHGRIAIGVLVVQDIAAVLFLAVSIGKVPSVWALALVLLVVVRPLILRLLEKTGHGELLVLFGIALALGGADLFELVGMKGDVGALALGMLLAGHPKSSELAKSLLAFKDLFLVGFFLSVGMTALPGWTELLVALILIVFLPLKVALYFGLFNLFRLRSSTSWRTSLNLANYSEFGLIVGAIGVANGWLGKEWLAVFAVALSISFMLSAPIINVRDKVYQQWRSRLKAFERKRRLSGEEDIDLSHVEAIVFGMGRMGTAAYNVMEEVFGDRLIGIEIDPDREQQHRDEGRHVFHGDATNPDFWSRASGLLDDLHWVLLTLPTHNANMAAALRLREIGYRGQIAATTKYVDEEEELKAIGVDCAFNIYAEAGIGFANSLQTQLADSPPPS